VPKDYTRRTERSLTSLTSPANLAAGRKEKAVEADSQKRSAAQILNDRTYSAVWAVGAEGGAFLCECNRPSCSERIAMTHSEYLSLRDRHELVYASGHDKPLP
jgi:hypothetical protein